jgi:peptidoglycan/xylan/chitin deacetylase (PgdA/CDA1 family)
MGTQLRRAIFCIGYLGLLFYPHTASFGQSSGSNSGSRCWSPEALLSHPEEKAIHKKQYDPALEPQDSAPALEQVAENLRGSIRSVRLRGALKMVALTFDLCENAGEVSGYDGQIIDTLRDLHVKATFFPSGKWLLDHKERAQQLLTDPLFEIGAHSWTHRNFRLLSPEQVEGDLALDLAADVQMRRSPEVQACFPPSRSQTVEAKHVTVFRFPFGTCNAESLKAVNDAGLLAIQWDVVSGDPAKGQSAEAIHRGVTAGVKPGSIVVMHANGRGWHTAEALPMIVEDLRKRGFEFATVGELLEKGEPVVAESCYELKPGDNARYDKLFPLEGSQKTKAVN